MSNQNNTPPHPEGELTFQMQAMTQMMERVNFVMGNVCDRLDRVEKRGNETGTSTQNDIGNEGFKDEIIGHREGFWQPRNQRDFMYFDEVLWQKKRRNQKERWYQMERNKEISVLKKESKSLSRILGEMKQELDVLTTSVNAQQASEREEKIRCNDDIRNRTAATFIQSCWRRLLARKELQRLQK